MKLRSVKKTLLCTLLLALSLGATAQDNTGYGANDDQFKSLAEEVVKLKKSNDKFNVYFNYAASAQLDQEASKYWSSYFANRQLRIEVKGHLTDQLYYRFRHHLNKSNGATSEDNFAKATDLMMLGYKVSDAWRVEVGKMGQIWGGFEYDENPLFIYQYSDFLSQMDIFVAGVTVAYTPTPTQEFAFEVSNSHSNKFADIYGENAMYEDGNGLNLKPLKPSCHPLTYIVNWNGTFFGDKLQTRWACGIQGEARKKYSRMVILGQRLNLEKLQCYFDYVGSSDGVDRSGIASKDMQTASPNVYSNNVWAAGVHYNTFVTKINWQFIPRWNLMVKGMYETVNAQNIPSLKDYRKSYGYVGSVEYYPIKSQDLRVFLAYIGKKVRFTELSGLSNYNTNRIELGFMYRIKAY